ncbi:hypothetical protein LTR53_007292 [Teratosphaeriaceae sp. CCFEE 6253]|nr:hypothetical protein LTR53_007292 [Teratosphaeriaceae sp. CCFEE 6253]
MALGAWYMNLHDCRQTNTARQSSSTVSPPSFAMRGVTPFDRKVEEMKPSKR